MKKFNKKGVIATVCAASAVALLIGGVLANFQKNAKADDTQVDKSAIIRDTDLTVDSSGVLQIKRNTVVTKESEAKKSPWTILMYIDGADLEQLSGFASKEIKEIVNANVTSENIDNANIIIQTGGSFFWSDRNVKADKTQRFILNKDKGLTLLEETDRQNMGDSATLIDYLEWGIQEYPAEKMGVIFWNHGSGIQNGVCTDPCFQFDSLSLAELEYSFSTACNKLNRRFDLIGFDTCLSGSLEYANVLAPYANYMVASAETEPADGWEYTTIVNTLLENPSIEPKDLGKTICDSYYAFFEAKSKNKLKDLTLSVYDLDKVDNVCIENNYLSKYMYDNVIQDQNNIDAYCKMQLSDKVAVYDENNIDIGSMLNYFDKNTNYGIQNYKKALDEFVVYNVLGEKYANLNSAGVSLYFPKEAIALKDLNIMRNVSVSPYYLQFLEIVNAKKAGVDVNNYRCNSWISLDTYFEDNFGYIDYELNGNNVELRMYSKLAENGKYVSDGFVDNWNNNFSKDKGSRNNSPSQKSIIKDIKCVDNQYTATIAEDYKDKVNKIYDSVFVKMDNDIVCLGQSGEAKYNSKTGEVNSEFNGQWLMLPDGQLLTTYIDEDFDELVYSIPVYINDSEMYIKIKMVGDSDYEVLGIWDGTANTVYAGRSYIELVSGTTITPIYDVYNEETEEFETEIGEEYTIKGNTDFLFTTLNDDEYDFSFIVDSIYGNSVNVNCEEHANNVE